MLKKDGLFLFCFVFLPQCVCSSGVTAINTAPAPKKSSSSLSLQMTAFRKTISGRKLQKMKKVNCLCLQILRITYQSRTLRWGTQMQTEIGVKVSCFQLIFVFKISNPKRPRTAIIFDALLLLCCCNWELFHPLLHNVLSQNLVWLFKKTKLKNSQWLDYAVIGCRMFINIQILSIKSPRIMV